MKHFLLIKLSALLLVSACIVSNMSKQKDVKVQKNTIGIFVLDIDSTLAPNYYRVTAMDKLDTIYFLSRKIKDKTHLCLYKISVNTPYSLEAKQLNTYTDDSISIGLRQGRHSVLLGGKIFLDGRYKVYESSNLKGLCLIR